MYFYTCMNFSPDDSLMSFVRLILGEFIFNFVMCLYLLCVENVKHTVVKNPEYIQIPLSPQCTWYQVRDTTVINYKVNKKYITSLQVGVPSDAGYSI